MWGRSWLFFACLLCFYATRFHQSALADNQVEPPDRRYLFLEDRTRKDREQEEKRIIQERRKQKEAIGGGFQGFDVNAPDLRYDTANSLIHAEGGISIGRGSAMVEAERGTVNVETGISNLFDNVRIREPGGSIVATEAEFNLQNRTGTLKNAELYLEEGKYRICAEEAEKYGELSFRMKDMTLTTCDCPDDKTCLPWRIRAKEADFTIDGYGITKNTYLEVHRVPIFYTPYLIFPVKRQRTSGLLPASFGNSNRTGFQLELPFFWAIDDSTDATIAPLIETKARYGVETEFRKVFSRTNSLELGATVLNESARNKALLGTDVTGLHDPSLNTNRFAGYIDQFWSTQIGAQPIQIILDGSYVSDDLLIREFENVKIADPKARYVTSRSVVRTSLFDKFSLEAAAEYNQAIVSDDDFVFQRVPQLTVNGIHRINAFGDNPYGLKLILSDHFESTYFTRKKSFDGVRTEIYERLRLPFYYRNIFDGDIQVGLRGTDYRLNETEVISLNSGENGEEVQSRFLEKSSNRFVPELNLKIGTVLERVYQVPEEEGTTGSFIKRIIELGPESREDKLVRLKHTVEPVVRYRYVPKVNQENNPQFDSRDRLAQRNVVTYGVVQRLFSRFEARDSYLYGIEESIPEARDFSPLVPRTPVDDPFQLGMQGHAVAYSELRRGRVRELANLELTQSFDVLEQQNGEDSRKPFSDLGVKTTFFPNRYVEFGAGANFDVEELALRSYNVGTNLNNKRGDSLRARFSFVEDRIRQLESNVELRINENLKLAYYTRYDDLEREFIENRFGFRYYSACNCWNLDMSVSDQSNPNETKFAFTVTLIGIGEITHKFLALADDDRS
jgi:LPS-assembly protein